MADFDSRHIKPNTEFYISIPVGNIDGTLDRQSDDGGDAFGSVGEAADGVAEDVLEYGGEMYVYKVLPVLYIRRLDDSNNVEISSIENET